MKQFCIEYTVRSGGYPTQLLFLMAESREHALDLFSKAVDKCRLSYYSERCFEV